MEVNKHINFLKRRGFLIKESSEQLGLDLSFDTVEPEEKTKVNTPKVDKPINVDEPELDLGVEKMDVSSEKDGFINIKGLCNRSKVYGVKGSKGEKASIWHLNGEDLYCLLLKDIDPNKYEHIRRRIDIIYRFFRPNNDNRTKFHNLIKLILTNTYMSINTLLLLSDYLENLEEDSDDSETRVAIDKLKDADAPLETEDDLEKLLRQIKTIEYSKYEKSFDGDFFSLVRTGLSIDYKDPKDDTFTNQLHNLIINNVPEKEMVLSLFDKIIKKNQNLNDFIKADLMANVPMYSNIGGREIPLIGKDQFIEVKKLDFDGDSYLSEFFAIYKNSKIGSWANNQSYFDLYNRVIDKLYVLIKNHSWGKDVLAAISRNFAGIIYKDGDLDRFIPSSEIELYWSNAGQRRCESERRLSIRYKVKSGKRDSYIFDHVSDTMEHETVPVKSSKKIGCNPQVEYGPNIATKYPRRIKLGEATVQDKRGGEWERDSSQGKMIRTKGGTKELDTSFDWVAQHFDASPDDPEVVALVQGLGSQEVLGEDFNKLDYTHYGEMNIYHLNNGEEWTVGDTPTCNQALLEYWESYIENNGWEHMGMDVENYVDVSSHWIENYAQEEADYLVEDMDIDEILERTGYDDEIESLEKEMEKTHNEHHNLKERIVSISEKIEQMNNENEDYLSYGLEEPPHDEERIENAHHFLDELRVEEGEFQNKFDSIEDEMDRTKDIARDDFRESTAGDIEWEVSDDPVNYFIERGMYRTPEEVVQHMGFHVDEDRMANDLADDRDYGRLGSYDGEVTEVKVEDTWYNLIRLD